MIRWPMPGPEVGPPFPPQYEGQIARGELGQPEWIARLHWVPYESHPYPHPFEPDGPSFE